MEQTPLKTQSQTCVGYDCDPSAKLDQIFTEIHQKEMKGLPFCREDLAVEAVNFKLYEQQWTGVMVTPWMVSLFILPGPQQVWERRQVGEKLGLQLGNGQYVFIVGEQEQLGQYLACSIQSPVTQITDQKSARKLAADIATIAFSLSVTQVEDEVDQSKRRLFGFDQ